MSHRGVLRAAAIAAGVMVWAGTASAVTFTGTGTVTAAIASAPAGPNIDIFTAGLPLDNQFDVNFNLASPSDTHNAFDLFSILTYNLYNTGTDTIDVNFTFTAPPSGASGTISATAVGHTAFFNNYLEVMWANPLTLNFDNGVALQIQLGDLDKTKSCTGSGRDKQCTYVTVLNNPQGIYHYGGVDGTFTYLDPHSNVATTPLPGALPLFATGMGMFGGFGLWRKRKARRPAS